MQNSRTMLNSRALTMPTADAVRERVTRGARTAIFSNLLVGLMLIVVMFIGGYFRFVGQNWDDFTHLHPDERFLTGVASLIGTGLNFTDEPAEYRSLLVEQCISQYPDTGGVGGYFDARCSNLNPHNVGIPMYVYGTLPLFIARGAAELTVEASQWWAENVNGDPTYDGTVWIRYDGVHLVWRALSALSEMGVIVLTFIIGRKLHDKWIGLLAAALYAFAVFSIQMAHFGTVDAMSNFFTVLGLLFIVEIQRKGALLNYVWFGIVFGAALASRINLAPLAGMIVLVSMLRALPLFDRNVGWGERERLITQMLLGLFLSGAMTFIAFRIFNPYAFDGPDFFGLTLNPRWLTDLNNARALVSGELDFPPNYQWAGRAQYFYPLKDMVLWGMGIAFGVVAWLAWVWAGYRLVRGRAGAYANFVPFVWVLLYFGFMGGQWVMVMRYFIPIYSSLAILAAWGMFSLVRNAGNQRSAFIRAFLHVGSRALIVVVISFTLLWALMFTNIYRSMLTRVQASHWVWENVPSDFSMRVEGAPENTPLIQIDIPPCGDSTDLLVAVTCFDTFNNAQLQSFVVPADGQITEIYAPHLGDPNDDPEPEVMRFTITRDNDTRILAQGILEADLVRDSHIVGREYRIPLDRPLNVRMGESYSLYIELVSGDAVVVGGSIFSWEGAWDDPIPIKVCRLPLGMSIADNPPPGLVGDPSYCEGQDPWFGLVNGHELNIIYDDDETKRQDLIRYLNDSDYITISSNRMYDSMLRNPMRFPMGLAYYEALFAGELGFELVAQFDETFEFGPLRVSDQHLPNYDSPAWLNEIESDEAFSVYDHPAVFIFQKSDDYDPSEVARILYDVPLTTINAAPIYLTCPGATTFYCDTTLSSRDYLDTADADLAPTQLRFTDEMWSLQTNGGTWSERFFSASPINTNMVISIVGWWVVVMVFGWAAFPLLFVVLPGLADRGYAMAKFMGMFLVGWGLWYLASVRVPVWTGGGVLIGLIALFVFGIIMIVRTKSNILAFIRQHWGRLLTIELITLAAFLAFVAVRLTNPDLWHPTYGGEKPMDFAYFNGVLRSTIFPPIDPWFSTGFINYYYYGFVTVGTPVLLLGMMPSIAYNLIVPTMFATTGIGAFAVAYSVVNAWRERRANGEIAYEVDKKGKRRAIRVGSPFAAGIMALLLAVVLGNLDTPRVFLTGVAQLGGYQKPTGVETFLIDEYIEANGEMPEGEALDSIVQRARSNELGDRVRYEITHSVDLLTSLVHGFSQLFSGARLPISADRWFWGPSRVLQETPGVQGNAITEMPIFTFIYGDLHAHMISMPMQFFAMAFLLNEVLTAGDSRRRARWLAIMIGAITIGMLRATNTWDWITYVLFGTLGLGFAWYLRAQTLKWKLFSRQSLLDMVASVGGFTLIHFAAVFPYTTWFVTVYSSVKLWEGGKTPLWAYFDIHGLFLFLIISLLAWDTARWFSATRVSALRGMYPILITALMVLGSILIVSFGLALLDYQVTIIALPLIIWCVILFFREGQSRAMMFVLASAALGLALTLGVEYIVLDGDIERQNTVFKFYLQVWLLFSVVGGVGFAAILRNLAKWDGGLRSVWSFALFALIAIAAMFPFMASAGKSVFRFYANQPLTLDGMDYMNYALLAEGNDELIDLDPTVSPFALSADYRMIRWMQENISGTPIIMEGSSDASEYRWNGRIAINTGMPSVAAWNFHQRQQRALQNMGRMVELRVANVNGFYQTPSVELAWDILRHYDVSYIVVGNLERAYYLPEGLAKFDTMVEVGLLDIVYQEGNSFVYRVNREVEFRDVQSALQERG